MKALPNSFGFYRAHSWRGYSVFLGYVFMFPRVVKYLSRLLFSKNGSIAFFTMTLPTVRDRIGIIILACAPAKIFDAIIPRIAIAMQTHFSIFWRTYKGTQNELVGGKHLALTTLPKLQKGAASFGTFCLHKQPYSPYPSKIRNLVKTFISGDWLPYFHGRNTSDKGNPCQC